MPLAAGRSQNTPGLGRSATQGALVGAEQVAVDLGDLRDPVALGDGDEASEVAAVGGDGVRAGVAVDLEPGEVLVDGGGEGQAGLGAGSHARILAPNVP